jgi:hypothetical protein
MQQKKRSRHTKETKNTSFLKRPSKCMAMVKLLILEKIPKILPGERKQFLYSNNHHRRKRPNLLRMTILLISINMVPRIHN